MPSKSNDLFLGQSEKFKNMDKELLVTLIGLKILSELFGDDKAKWKLVALKSKKLLMKELGFQNQKDIDALVTEYQISLYVKD